MFPIPVSIITGFLGAGKTTLLNRLLKDPSLTDAAVIVNEFGDVAIDHLLVEQASDGIIELADGCLCCTVRGELVDTLADLVDRLQSGRIKRLSRVIIETTGLADPVPVLQSIMAHPVLMQAFRLDGVITLVDAVNGTDTLNEHVEAVKQVAVADRIVVTKQSLQRDGAAREELEMRLRHLNPNAAIIDADAVPAAASKLLECGLYDPVTKTADVRRWLGEAADADIAHHDHHHGEHDLCEDDHHHHHDHRMNSFSLVHEGPVPYSAIATFLDLLQSTHGEKLLRMKGIVELTEDPSRPLVLHGVQKLMHPPARLNQWPDGPRGTRLVLIGMDLPDSYVRRLFSAITNQLSVDTPDLSAVADNPLAIAGFKQ
ncbi:MAG: GTP-binding protein [Rhizobiaceae bacterium]|nr:GTP-binding protein [Rhizobiaceae bacterium]